MFASLVVGTPTVFAMLALYAVLGAVSIGVTARTRPQNQLRLQVNAWWLIFPFVTASLLLYPLGPALLVVLIGMLAQRELGGMLGAGQAAACLAVLIALVALAWTMPTATMVLLAALLALQLLQFARRRERGQLLLLLFLLMCFGISFLIQFVHLPFAPQTNLAWLFFLFVTTALNDIGQFVFGKIFGKQKIARHISPNKTWQGLAGGVLISLIVSVLIGRYLQLAPLSTLLPLAVLLSLGGFCGDLMFSAAKRFLGIKDFSQLIPGHGGILDRVDSLVITAPLLFFVITFFGQGFPG